MTEEEMFNAMLELSNSQLMDSIAEHLWKKENAEEWIKAAKREMQTRLIDEELVSIKTEQGRGCTLSEDKMNFTPGAENNHKFHEWLDSIGEGALVKPTITPASGVKAIQHAMDNDIEIPKWIKDKITYYKSVTYRKGKQQ